jgi:hypothetical protein
MFHTDFQLSPVVFVHRTQKDPHFCSLITYIFLSRWNIYTIKIVLVHQILLVFTVTDLNHKNKNVV